MEQEEAHVISIGYQKGADQVGFSVTFNIEVQQTPFGMLLLLWYDELQSCIFSII